MRFYRVRPCSVGMAYLVQATQNLEYPVPLVAGREALLRVFPTAPAGSRVPVPPVRASFYASGSATASHTVEIPGKPGPLPPEIDEIEKQFGLWRVAPDITWECCLITPISTIRL